MVEMEFVQSSNIESIGYSMEMQELHVSFLGSSTVYVYQGVPQDVHERLMSSGSKGSFFNREVKHVYPVYKL